ncbi:MAG TPA: APC family permease [Chitinophagales bacterium]|nr:APC family permease [Chitinophagales bacterium]
MKLQKKIGLAGGTAIVVGGVIGMGAYALVPSIVEKSGDAAWLALSIALLVSVVSVLPLIQISSALPVAGGGYMYASRLLSPVAGTLTSFWALLGGASSLGLISIGLVEYFAPFLPFQVSPHLGAIVLIASFYFVYLFSLKLLSNLQIIMSIQLLLALLLYCIPVASTRQFTFSVGMPHSNTFLVAVILCTNLCLGFQIIIEMGEEMHHPEKNIPLSLLIGSVTIFIIYLAIVFTYSGIVGPDGIALKPKLVDTARPYFSAPAIWFLQLGMISSALTSYNGGAIALPREIFAMARDLTLPEFLSRTNSKGNPTNAVTFFFLFVIAELLLGQLLDSLGLVERFFGKDVIEFYGFMTIMGIMLLTISISLAAYKVPSVFPKQYAGAYIRFSKPVLNTFIVVSILFSLSLIAIIFTKWIVVVIYALFSAIILLYHAVRKKQLQNQGVEMGKHFDAWND